MDWQAPPTGGTTTELEQVCSHTLIGGALEIWLRLPR